MKLLPSVIILAFAAVGLHAGTLGELAGKMKENGAYADSCSYEVLLPAFSDPIVYKVRLEGYQATEGDSLAPCDYLLEWSLPTPTGESSGFSAYFAGNHFRYRDERLQEYHADADLSPFAPAGIAARGVQQQAQFADLLPAFIAERFAEMEKDSSYVYTIKTDANYNGGKATVVKGVRRVNGSDASEFTYTLDGTSLLPLKIEFENNPGQLSEQSITVTYSGHPGRPAPESLNEESLSSRKSEAFRYRENSFSLETLPGQMLPEISSPTTTGERYFHGRGEGFACPTLLVFLDTSVGSTRDVIEGVRSAVDNLPMQTDVVWAFVDHRSDDIDDVIARPRPGEHILMNSGASARRCGIGALTPVIIYVKADGRVADVTNGYNQELSSIVIQKASLMNE